jgi:hypothetical protein
MILDSLLPQIDEKDRTFIAFMHASSPIWKNEGFKPWKQDNKTDKSINDPAT